MNGIELLPNDLADRYKGWKTGKFAQKADLMHRLATKGQSPFAMVIACCDSRVMSTEMFNAEQGEIFLHRNIANLVPPCQPDGQAHGTSAAIEYAVTALLVPRLIVLGHSACGGVKGCHDMCRGDAPGLDEKSSFVGRWMDALKPGYAEVADIEDETTRLAALEREGVKLSLRNLMTFPFVKSRVEKGNLTLHGLWTDIGDGTLEQYDPASDEFVKV